ncbi:aminotransferase class IV [Aggregatibacter actinomycetemcomitans]|uniref:aminotransferase class IV family protein n=1 Tax=Aggregatibacter actinomycetemcomitans TaxID=714 RepID=UPI00197B4955|nr:aminotransferase class IV family protein [Aggregatibacter actinomycetemcomitans]MBN6074817.1 aminotransferase class IV [Aggregatibacter actinomycetemcomitans]
MEFPLFETLAIAHGKVRNIEHHQQRYERSLQAFYGKSAVVFPNVFQLTEQIQVPTALRAEPLIRCRIDYNAEQILCRYFPYTRKTYRTFKPIVCDHIDYGLKYTDRTLLNDLLAQKGDCDEIMIIKNGYVTDCSIGNLIFRKNTQWFTPDTPLLEGTQRATLLAQGRIKVRSILATDLHLFEEVRLINALNGLDD